MDSDTLNTASNYLNNLLLTRGLLKNGKKIDFVKPSKESRAQIINLVHDLLLKRDRDEESREDIATNLQSFKNENDRKDIQIEHLQSKLIEKDNSINRTNVEGRNVKNEMKTLQTNIKIVQSQLNKSKLLSDQIKLQCINDIRKRDIQIEKLKSHLQGQQRGNKSLVMAPSFNVSGRNQILNTSIHELQDPAYSLKQESNEFLTQLGQNLSEENDGLIILIRKTINNLNELLGQNDILMSEEKDEDSYKNLGLELQTLLDILKDLLTNPNFVSVEEVDIRDEEISRLRDGWETMEAKWQNVLFMMDGWRQRLEGSGDTINIDELKKGLGLGDGIDDEIKQFTSPTKRSPIKIHLQTPQILDDTTGDQLLYSIEKKKIRELDFDLQQSTRPVRGQQLRQISINLRSPKKVILTPSDDCTQTKLDHVLSTENVSLYSEEKI